MELAPFEEDCAQTEEEEAARLAEKAREAGSFLELMLSHAVAADEEASAPTVEVRGWMPEDVTAQAELISYTEKELYMETALMQAELRFYDGEGRSWLPTLPVTVCIDGDVVKDVRDAKMNPTVYIYEERPEEAKEEDDRFFSVEALTAARSVGEEKTYERELDAVRAEVNERGLAKDEETPDAVCFEIQSEAVRFAVTARQPDRTYTAANEDGNTEMVVVGKLPRSLSAEIAPLSAEVAAEQLPGDVVLGWELSLIHTDEPDYRPEGTMKLALRDSALVELQDGMWDLQLWQLRADGTQARVKDAVFKGEDLRFSAVGLSTFVVVKVAVEKKLTATDGSTYSVEAVYDSHAGIPANAELVVRELLPEDEDYARYMTESASRMERNPAELGFAKVLDISFRDPETGAEFKPNQDVKINIELLSEDLDEYTNVSVVRCGQETKKVNASTNGDTVAFETGDASVFVVTGVCVEKTITAGDGSTYHVTVSYDKNAGIPEGAELEVRELTGDEYLEYLSKTAEFLSREEEQLVFARFFDITIVKDGVVYEPDKSVSVSIELMDRPETQGVLRVVHFGEETELLENEETADGCLKFNTDSFSVYAITDEDGNVIVPRAFYHFYDGTIDKGRQIIKNQGTLTEVTHSEQGSLVFLGWFIYNEEDGSWGEQVFFDTPIQILMGAEEAVYGNSVVVPREKDADGKWINHVDVTVKTRFTSDFATISFMTATTSTNYNDASIVKRSEKVPMPIGETSTVYQIPDVTHEEYTIQSTNPDYTFVGWSEKKPSRQQDYYNDTVSATRPIVTSLTVQNQQRYVLYPVFMKANWLIFKTGPVGSGAEYVAPVFILKGNTAADKIPEDPKWRGYKFLYWTTEPTFDEETGELIQFEAGHEPARFNFNTPINARTTLYAYWESGYSTYTVITWIQSVNDNKNAAPQDRSYEFQDQVTRDAKVGEIVNLTDADKSLVLTGFHHKTEQNVAGDVHVDTVNASVASSGATVLNVYYDRDLMTMQFYDKGDLSVPAGGYNDAVWTSGSRYVKNYTGLYGQSLQQNGYVWPAGTWSYFQNPNNNSDVSGMSYLGQFVFPNPEIGTYFRAYKTGDTEAARIEFFLQNPDGSYPTTRSDYGSVGNAGTFNFTDKYDGFMVTQYRRYYEKNGTRYYVDAAGNQVNNANDAWENVSVGGSTPLSAAIYTGNNGDVAWAYEGGGETVFYTGTRYKGSTNGGWGAQGYYIYRYNGNGSFSATGGRLYNPYQATDNNGTQYAIFVFNNNYGFVQLVKKTKYRNQNLNLEIRYARRNYNISYFDSMDGQALTTLLLDGSTVQRKNGVLYGGDIGNFYPDPEFEPMAKEPGWAFNNRWYSDQGQTTQIFFHELTEEDQAKLWYYIDTSGEKIYIDRPASEEELTMNLEDDGRYYDRDKAEVIKQMPNRNLALYAGFNHTWYWVKIDPNGGYLNGNNPADSTNSTYFWAQYGTKIVEYPTYRTFVRDDNGTYYYHYDEFNTEDPNGEQPRSRKAYYTTNASESTDGGLRYRPANEEEDEGFEFAGWYLVDENNTTGKKYQRFNFEESFVKENMILRAMWKQRGAYRVYYSMAKAVDPSGNPISGLTLSGTAPVDDFLYANDSTILVLAGDALDPINAQAADNTEYDFLGWYFNNGVYAAGEVFEANPYLAERYPGPDTPANAPYDTFILYPVFQTAGDGSGDTSHTMLVLDSNGGYATEGYVLPEEAAFNGDKTQVYFLQNDIPLNMDVELPVQLPADQGSKNVFSKDKAEFLGWAFNRDAKTPAFVASQIVGVDNDQGGGFNGQNGNILYAVWRRTEVTVRVRLIDEKSSAPIAGGSFTLTDSANAEVEGTEGGITSGSDGYLIKGTVRDFNIKTPTIPNTTTSFALTEIETASGYIPLEAPVAITVDFDGTIKYRLEDGTEAEATRVDGDCFLIVVKERLALCKVVNGENEKLFSALREAVEYAKTIPGTASVQMLTDYAMPNTDFVTLTAEDNIQLTTASKTGKNPYRGEGTVATVTRGDSGISMFTVDGGTLDLTNIILDGGSASNKTCYTDGGIISVKNGGSLKVEVDTVFQNTVANSNTNAESSGGAIAASGANTSVEILGTANNPVQFENCTAKHNGGAVYIGGGATLLAESVTFADCTANAMGHSVSYGGGAIAVRNCANDAGNPDAIIRNVTIKGCVSDGLGGGLLVTGAAVTVSDSTIGNTDSTAGGNSANRGGGLSATDNAYVKITDSGIYGNDASVKGGAMYVYYAVVAMGDSSVVGNTSEVGAGIYVTEGAKLQLSGAPDFGGPGVLQDGSLSNASGNFAYGTLSGQTNGLADYAKPRQDIYLAETAVAPASLEIMGNLNADLGSIWVWAEHELHYQMVKPFAVINSDEEITKDTMEAFRNAREDSLTSCRGGYLTGQTGSNPAWIYWTGGVDVGFMKVDGFGDPLAGAQFTLYSDLACTDEVERGLGVSDNDGIAGFSLISAGIYYMKETKSPNGYKDNENKYIVLIGDSNLVAPDVREGVWATALAGITQADIDAQVEAYKENEKIGMGGYAIFALDENNVAVTTPDIAAKGVVNISTSKRLVIFSKIDTVLKPLKGAKFILRSYDGAEFEIDGESFESDESGIFFVGELPVGTYYLEETNVPEDYKRPTHFFVFQVTEDGVKGLKRNEGGADTFEITNTLIEPASDEYLIP